MGGLHRSQSLIYLPQPSLARVLYALYLQTTVLEYNTIKYNHWLTLQLNGYNQKEQVQLVAQKNIELTFTDARSPLTGLPYVQGWDGGWTPLYLQKKLYCHTHTSKLNTKKYCWGKKRKDSISKKKQKIFFIQNKKKYLT